MLNLFWREDQSDDRGNERCRANRTDEYGTIYRVSGPGSQPDGPRDHAREFSGRVADPVWRLEACLELEQTPNAINGLLIGIGALTHRDVLDLYPVLRALAEELPPGVRDELAHAVTRPLSPAGVAALRLGLSA